MTSFKTAHMECKLQERITKEAKRNKLSFSEQVQSYIDHNIRLQEQVDELRERINKIQDVA